MAKIYGVHVGKYTIITWILWELDIWLEYYMFALICNCFLIRTLCDIYVVLLKMDPIYGPQEAILIGMYVKFTRGFFC